MINSVRNSWLFVEFISWCILHVYGEYMQNELVSLKINEISFCLCLLLDKYKITYNNHINNDWQHQKQLVICWVHLLVYFVCMQWIHAKWEYFYWKSMRFFFFLCLLLDKCKITYKNHVNNDWQHQKQLVGSWAYFLVYLHVHGEYMQNEHISLKINEILLFLAPFALQMHNDIQQQCKQWLTTPGTAGWLLSSFLGLFCVYMVNTCKISIFHWKSMWFHFPLCLLLYRCTMTYNSHVNND